MTRLEKYRDALIPIDDVSYVEYRNYPDAKGGTYVRVRQYDSFLSSIKIGEENLLDDFKTWYDSIMKNKEAVGTANIGVKAHWKDGDSACVKPAATADEADVTNDKHDPDTLDDFYVIEMPGSCGGWLDVTRSRVRAMDCVTGRLRGGIRPLTRADIYRGKQGEAECEYAHSFMCSGFPTGYDPDRPTKEEWMSQKPFDFEVDRFLSEKLFPENKRC